MHANDISPFGSMVLVREIEAPQQLPSGLILTTDLNKYTVKAEVVAVGDGDKHRETGARIPNDVEVGDTVYYTAYSGNTEMTTDNGEKLVLVANRDIIAKEVD